PLIGNREIVFAQDGEVGIFSFGKRSEVMIVESEPCRAFGIEPQSLQPRDLLPIIRQRPCGISTRSHIEQRQPWVEGRDIRRVGADTGMDSRVQNSPERWTTGCR